MFDPSHQPLDSHAGAGAAQTDTKGLAIPQEGDELRSLLEKEGLDVEALLKSLYVHPPELDASHPLQDYYISSSHNTYLPAGQLYGNSSAEEYVSVISRAARCVEIDAWADGALGPPNCKVTHGFTLTSRLPLATVLDAVVRGMEKSSSRLPLIISLENHTENDAFQKGLVDEFKRVLKGRLVEGEIEGVGRRPVLEHFLDRIILMVEYHPPTDSIPSEGAAKEASLPPSAVDEDDSEDSSDDEAALEMRKEKKAHVSIIGPALAHLGFYAASIKPGKGHAWVGAERQEIPPNPLINISESALLGLLDPKTDKKGEIKEGVIKRTKEGMMRVYPKGLRVFSKNPDPLPFWQVGAQVVALNFQTFDANLQLNEALFSGTDGWVLKPPHLRSTESGPVKGTLPIVTVKVTLGGISGLKSIFKDGEDKRRPYCKAYLHHSKGVYKARSSSLQKVTRDSDSAVWNESFGEFSCEADGLIFIRLVFKNNEAFAGDDHLAVFTAFLDHTKQNEWGLVRLLDPKGKETKAVLGMRIDVTEGSK
ncbi:PLC-like phosphodiesterase [Mrakia frigida]|uniref:PLC-like phosphodiesterase n=1 Tax=Mrakia frigida TaxID=29902 RepID=UPI003FCBF241